MSEHEHDGFRIVFYEKRDKNEKWTDEVEVNFTTGAIGANLTSSYARPRDVAVFETVEQARDSALQKAKAIIGRIRR